MNELKILMNKYQTWAPEKKKYYFFRMTNEENIHVEKSYPFIHEVLKNLRKEIHRAFDSGDRF